MLSLNNVLIFLLCCVPMAFANSIKAPNVAGGFYPNDKDALLKQIKSFEAQVPALSLKKPLIIVAPHAGYIYSGSIAAFAFKAVQDVKPSTVIVIAPSHFYPFEGVALWPLGGFETPLGVISVDEKLSRQLMEATPVIKENREVFNQEHALEVELPFIQQSFGPSVKIVPLLIGQPNLNGCESLAIALNQVIGDRQDILVVISSDFSHYHPYDKANKIDAMALNLIKQMDIEGFYKANLSRQIELCGFLPVTVGMMLAKLRGLTGVDVLKYANSGDTAGDKNRVVGYGAISFYENNLTKNHQKTLLTVARQSIEQIVRQGKALPVINHEASLNEIQGAFVTLHRQGQLRGCIGTIIANQPLIQTVHQMAIAAAIEDPRFNPVTPEELKDITIEISVLSIPVRIKSIDEIILGRDGVIVSDGGKHQGVFLPQVATETGWSKEDFLNQLCEQKAGLKANCWMDKSIALYTFRANVFHE